MNSFTIEQKQELFDAEANGVKVYYLSYDPNTVIGTPETDATDGGLVEYYREDTADLVEVIYTSVLGFDETNVGPNGVLTNDGFGFALNANFSDSSVRSTVNHDSGKYYLEFQVPISQDDPALEDNGFGFCTSAFDLTVPTYVGSDSNGFAVYEDGSVWVNGGASFVSPWTNLVPGSWARVAIDIDAGKVWFGDAVHGFPTDPATGAGPALTFGPGTQLFVAMTVTNNAFFPPSNNIVGNFGQMAFQYTPPVGFVPWGSL